MPDTVAPTLTVNIDADTTELAQQLAEAARLSSRFSSALGNAFVDVSLKGKSFGDVLRSLTLSLSQIALKAAFKPLTDALGSGLAGLFTGTAGVAFAKGGVVPGPLPVPFAQGGVISSPITFPLGNNRMGIAGERGAEAILPLARGPDGNLGVRANAAGAVHVTFNVTTPDAESFQRSETQLAALLARAVAQGQRNL
ncbi:MAG: phage tail tape measure protein [Hyphomicrobiaceae bacterium]|nr:MAG: phage tail tape measure protein [Hyphomicrobiaceae bacterium]